MVYGYWVPNRALQLFTRARQLLEGMVDSNWNPLEDKGLSRRCDQHICPPNPCPPKLSFCPPLAPRLPKKAEKDNNKRQHSKTV